jgi:subtilisin family serine protease
MSEAPVKRDSLTPKYLVIFEKIKESNISLMSKTLNLKEAKGISTRASCTILSSSTKPTNTRVYSRLGIAVTDLNDDELVTLEKHDDVQSIVLNEQRSIPPILEVDEEIQARVDLDPLTYYLRGMQDAIETILKFHTGEVSSSLPIGNRFQISNTSQLSWCLQAIGISSNYRLTGKDTQVAILDTGIDLEHPDFVDRLVEEDNAFSFVPGESVQDLNGHGTHCSGIVGGPITSNGTRRYGVAPDVELAVGKVLNNQGEGFDDWIIDGIDWAVDRGANIISMSLGSLRNLGEAYPSQYERIASILLEQDVLIVAAAGNSSNRPFYTKPVENPAACPSILAVAASDRNSKIASFSCAQLDNIGTLDICAPGVAVYSSWKGGGFRTISGTSMATPHVAGVAALYRQFFSNISARELWNRMLSNAIYLGNVSDFGRGMVRVPT